MTEPEREKWKKEKEQREGRTHCPVVRRKRVAHSIGITGHDVLPRKVIKVVSIDCPREMWRIN